MATVAIGQVHMYVYISNIILCYLFAIVLPVALPTDST